jgi:hypothetical protein
VGQRREQCATSGRWGGIPGRRVHGRRGGRDNDDHDPTADHDHHDTAADDHDTAADDHDTAADDDHPTAADHSGAHDDHDHSGAHDDHDHDDSAAAAG